MKQDGSSPSIPAVRSRVLRCAVSSGCLIWRMKRCSPRIRVILSGAEVTRSHAESRRRNADPTGLSETPAARVRVTPNTVKGTRRHLNSLLVWVGG